MTNVERGTWWRMLCDRSERSSVGRAAYLVCRLNKRRTRKGAAPALAGKSDVRQRYKMDCKQHDRYAHRLLPLLLDPTRLSQPALAVDSLPA